MVKCDLHGSDHEPWQCPGASKIEQRALELQARGPDEFPFGYYKYLAQKEMEDEHAEP